MTDDVDVYSLVIISPIPYTHLTEIERYMISISESKGLVPPKLPNN